MDTRNLAIRSIRDIREIRQIYEASCEAGFILRLTKAINYSEASGLTLINTSTQPVVVCVCVRVQRTLGQRPPD